jgi:DNA-binding Lrp family transcriptional regulator
MHGVAATYQELGRQVRLSANTVADRVRRLQALGVIREYRAELSMAALGRAMEMISDIRLHDHRVDRTAFEAQLRDVAPGHWHGPADRRVRLPTADRVHRLTRVRNCR